MFKKIDAIKMYLNQITIIKYHFCLIYINPNRTLFYRFFILFFVLINLAPLSNGLLLRQSETALNSLLFWKHHYKTNFNESNYCKAFCLSVNIVH